MQWDCLKCSEIPENVYDAMNGIDLKKMKYTCNKCKNEDSSSLKGLLLEMKTLSMNQFKKLDDRLGKIEDRIAKIDEVESRLNRLETTIEDTISEKVEGAMEGNFKTMVLEEVRSSMHELKLREERASNIMIFNCPEDTSLTQQERSKHDHETFQTICTETKVPAITPSKLNRIGTPGGDKPRPIRVALPSSQQKRDLLKGAKELQHHPTLSDYKIAPDLTPQQQKDRRALVTELRRRKAGGEKDLIIRQNRIVKGPPKPETLHNEPPSTQPTSASAAQDLDEEVFRDSF